jgi:elongation factor G
MKDYRTEHLFSAALIGHGGDGKTTLTEAMLFAAGAIERMGKTTDGTATTDYDPEEIKRSISISAALAPLEWKDKKITFIDLPGYFDFVGELNAPLQIADFAMIVMAAQSGMAVGTEKAHKLATRQQVPHLIIINQMDREHADFDKCLSQLRDKYGSSIAPLVIPVIEKGVFTGVANVLTGKVYSGAGKTLKITDPSSEVKAHIDSLKEETAEAAAGADDELMEKFFDQGELSDEEIKTGLSIGIASASVVPVVCCSATTGVGISALLDTLIDIMPNAAGKSYKASTQKPAPRKPVKALRKRPSARRFSKL